MVAIKTAIIGLGIMGQRMLEQMTLHPEFVVDTIWDPDSAACQRLCSLAGDLRITQTVNREKGVHMMMAKNLLDTA